MMGIRRNSDAGAIYGALFCAINFNGQSDRADNNFRNIAGKIQDLFTVFRAVESTAAVPVLSSSTAQADLVATTTTITITIDDFPNGYSGLNIDMYLVDPTIGQKIGIQYDSALGLTTDHWGLTVRYGIAADSNSVDVTLAVQQPLLQSMSKWKLGMKDECGSFRRDWSAFGC